MGGARCGAVNDPNPIIEREEVRSEASDERLRTLRLPPHPESTALKFTLAIVVVFWLAVMWAVAELMLLEIS